MQNVNIFLNSFALITAEYVVLPANDLVLNIYSS